MVLFHLRREYKAGEKRTPITPTGAKALLDAGHQVVVERFADRCFPDKQYEDAGCTMVDGDAWRTGTIVVFVVVFVFW
jgi:saccharopine dehydrogenase (NAD+, L-lysine-forming)